MKLNFLLSLIFIALLTGCTIQKRQHQKGFHVQWKHQSVSTHATDKTTEALVINHDTNLLENVVSIESPSEGTFPLQNKQEAPSVASGNNLTIGKTPIQKVKTKEIIPLHSRHQTVRLTNSKREISGNKKKGDIWFLMTGIFLTLGTWTAFKTNKKRLNKVTNWAAKNPKKAQIAIAGMQIPLSAMALYGGFNFGKLGFEMSTLTSLSLAGVMAASFASVPFFKKKNEFVLAKKLNKRRIGFFGIILSGTLMAANAGNYISNNQSAPFYETLNSLDQAIFSDSNPEASISTNNEALDASAEQQTKIRKYVNAGLVIIGIILFALLIVTFCAGLCGAAFSFYFLVEGAILGVPFLIISILVAVFSMKGMIALPKSNFFREPKK